MFFLFLWGGGKYVQSCWLFSCWSLYLYASMVCVRYLKPFLLECPGRDVRTNFSALLEKTFAAHHTHCNKANGRQNSFTLVLSIGVCSLIVRSLSDLLYNSYKCGLDLHYERPPGFISARRMRIWIQEVKNRKIVPKTWRRKHLNLRIIGNYYRYIKSNTVKLKQTIHFRANFVWHFFYLKEPF